MPARKSRLSRRCSRPVAHDRLLAWKASLKKVGDNPDYIEQNMSAIMKELHKNDPDTSYIKSKVGLISEWLGEIDKFHARSGLDLGYSKIVQVYPKKGK
jgi:hypothetical protein